MQWRIALAQWDIIAGDPEGNRAKVDRLMERAGVGTDVMVLPELWTTGYALADLGRLAEAVDGPTGAFLADLARRWKCHVVGGSTATVEGGRLYNQTQVFDRSGRRAGSYRKVHLFGPLGERECFSPGEDLFPVDLEGVRCGTLICYDLRFPEAARRLALAGATVLFFVAQWPMARGEHWRALLIARAIENQCFVIGVNAVGERYGTEFAGGSLIVDPMGKILAEGGTGEEIVTATIDLGAPEKARRDFCILRDRVPEAYI